MHVDQHFPALVRAGKERAGLDWAPKGASSTLLLQSDFSVLKHPMGTHSLEPETGGAQATEGSLSLLPSLEHLAVAECLCLLPWVQSL